MSKKTPHPTGGNGGNDGGEASPADAERLVDRLARLVGLTVNEPLQPLDIRRLRKPPSSYAPIIDDTARQLIANAGRLHLKNVTGEGLLAAYQKRQHLVACEVAFKRLYRSVYEERLQLDDEILGDLLLIERRVATMAEDDPALADAFSFLTDYLGDFRRGAASPAPATGNDPTDGSTDGGAAGPAAK